MCVFMYVYMCMYVYVYIFKYICVLYILYTLDWQKAFDRIPTSALLSALRRFGLPSEFVDAVQDIYTDRFFASPTAE